VTEQLTLDLGYRYFDASDIEFDVTVDLANPVVVSGEGDFEQQAVTLGLRYTFAPPPPPMAAPPPRPEPRPAPSATCPQSDFVVYFEWDRSDLNQAAMDTINAAIQRARQCALRAVRVVGHTDTSGSAEYNDELSQRRAAVVRDALVAAGMSASIIAVEARGEADLARATGDGVREPLNRRTAVTIAFR
jgi:outer membrane protein OmpA-like peptidoglycan-associated protein